jgi:hypothetical protein
MTLDPEWQLKNSGFRRRIGVAATEVREPTASTLGETSPQRLEIVARKDEFRNYPSEGLVGYLQQRWDNARRAFTAALEAVRPRS